MRALGFVVLLAGTGAVLGFATFKLATGGYFVRWEPIPPPPQPATEIITSREFYLYVQIKDDQTYQWDEHSWQLAAVPANLEERWQITNPCTHSWPEFSPLAGAPQGVIDCVHDEGVAGEFFNKHVYALTEEGDLWEWAYLDDYWSVFFAFFGLPCIGSIVGLLVAGIVLVRKRLVGKTSSAA